MDVRSRSIPVTEKGTLIVPEKYNFGHPRRGKCVIINNSEFDITTGQGPRDGTNFDADACESLFKKLGFETVRHDNFRSMEIRRKMRELAAEDHSDADCFACVILSHGKEGRIYGTDGLIPIESITGLFKGDECKTLAGKPKLFFIQACRGTKFDPGADAEDAEDSPDAGIIYDAPSVRRIPAEADFMMAYSVVPGYFSWRNNVDGSWFIQALFTVFWEHGDRMELMQMMTIVNKIVAYDFSSCTDESWTDNMKQVPCVVSMLTKSVIFDPKPKRDA